MNTKCGYIAIVGRPNVGKSTLLNTILGQKISITARKPQTTRHKILGIKTQANIQTVYVDTPGIHKDKKKAINRYMRQEVKNALAEVDIVVLVADGLIWKPEDQLILDNLHKINKPIILAINKVDQIKDKNKLLPHLKSLTKEFNFAATIPISAKNGTNTVELETLIATLLPESPFYFMEDQITDRSERFLITEIIREKLTRLLGQELPHELTVAIEKFSETKKITHIAAIIYVERTGQKAIIVGKDGIKLKEIGTKSRVDIERMLNKKVFLQLWVKVKRGWSDNERVLQSLGYNK